MTKQYPSKQYLSEVISNREFAESVPPEIVIVMARQLLSGLEQEPVADVVAWHHPTEERNCDIRLRRHDLVPGPLYAAPQLPQPAVVDAISTRQAISQMEECEPCDSINVAYKYGWNACRAAMLQGAEPVSQHYKLRDGWVAVPVEPTAEMVKKMRYHCGGYDKNIKDGYKAMLAAAPQQELK